NNVVIRSSWDNYRETGPYRRLNTIEYRVAITCFYAKELVKLVYLRPDFFPRLQRHHDELAVSCRIQHGAKLLIFEREALNVSQETLHDFSSFPHSLSGGADGRRRSGEDSQSRRPRMVTTGTDTTTERSPKPP